MKTLSLIILWFSVVTTVAILFASCSTTKKATCPAYGQVETEEKV
jgi:hypothetical protein